MDDTPHNQSGGVNVDSDRVSVGGDVVSRDKTEQQTTNTTFDQRGQSVGTQVNIAGNLNLSVNPSVIEQQATKQWGLRAKDDAQASTLGATDLQASVVGCVMGLLASLLTELGTTFLNDRDSFFLASVAALFCGGFGAFKMNTWPRLSRNTPRVRMVFVALSGFSCGLLAVTAFVIGLRLLAVLALIALLAFAELASRHNRPKSQSHTPDSGKDAILSIHHDDTIEQNHDPSQLRDFQRITKEKSPQKWNWREDTAARKPSVNSSGSAKKSPWLETKPRHDDDKRK